MTLNILPIFLKHTLTFVCLQFESGNKHSPYFKLFLFNPLPDDKLDSSKLKEFAYDILKFDENGIKLFERVENTVGKGEIACYEQYLLFPQCFRKACFPGASKGVIVWYGLKRTQENACQESFLQMYMQKVLSTSKTYKEFNINSFKCS